MNLDNLKIAITHDSLYVHGGAEVVLLELLRMFPKSDLFVPVYWKKNLNVDLINEISKHKIETSFLSKFPVLKKYSKLFIPFYIRFFKKLKFNNYDLVISSSANFSKWLNSGNALHIAYIHTPPRFLWGYSDTFYHKIPKIFKFILKPLINKWKNKDFEYVNSADLVLANSINIKKKITKSYGVKSHVLYPPVPKLTLTINKVKESDYYLIIQRLVSYKQFDKIINVFNKNGKKLIFIGTGPEEKYLRSIAKDNISFLGFVDENTKLEYLLKCRALIYPGKEDFGISMVESLLAKKPILAFKEGGAKEIVDEKTGVLYDSHSMQDIQVGIDKLENKKFKKEDFTKRAELFSTNNFQTNLKKYISTLM